MSSHVDRGARRARMALVLALVAGVLGLIPTVRTAGADEQRDTRPAETTSTDQVDRVDRFDPIATALPYRRLIEASFYTPIAKDLAVRGIEVTQGIQCFDTSAGLAGCPDNSLPLVTDKASTARIYLRTGSFLTSRLENVPVRLYYRLNGGAWSHVDAAGPATALLNQASVLDSVNVFFHQFGGSATVDFYAVVDPNNTIAESNESNNRYPASGVTTVEFAPRRTMRIVGQRLDYNPSGYTGTRQAAGWAVDGGAATWWEHLLPIRDGGIDYRVASGFMDWTTSLGSGDGQHALISTLNYRWIMSLLPWIGGDSAFRGARHVYGWAPDAGYGGGHADMPVYPHAGGFGIVGIGTDEPGTSSDSPGDGALIFGHELVHDYDLMHTDTGGDDCGSDDENSQFPYDTSSIQEFGFNPLTGKVYDPALTHDLMSYCPAGGSTEGWISPYTWEQMYDNLAPTTAPAASAAATPTPIGDGLGDIAPPRLPQTVAVNASVFRKGGGELGSMYVVPGTAPAITQEDGDWAIQLLSDGEVVSSHAFDADFRSEYSAHGEGADGDLPVADVHLVVPWPAETTSVALVHGDEVLATRDVSANPPVVTAVRSDDRSWEPGSSHVLSWDATDLDGDPLQFLVLVSNDDGASWQLLDTTTETSMTIASDSIAGGDTRFRVIANDGIHVGDAVSSPVAVPDKAPVPTIIEPAPHRTVPAGDLLLLSGSATDFEDGTIGDDGLQWSDGGTVVGNGRLVPVDGLAPGPHVLTLTATDSAGNVGTATVPVFVTAVDPPVLSPVAEGDEVRPETTFLAAPGTAGLTCTVDFGDGTTEAGEISGDRCVAPPHRYGDDGSYRIVFSVLAGAEPVGAASAAQEVVNEAPVGGESQPAIARRGEPFTFTLSFTDPGVLDTHEATIDWGDGTTEAATVTGADGAGTVSADHTYADAGLRTVRVVVTDDDGGSTSVGRTLPVVDPDGGFLTGGGHILRDGRKVHLTANAKYRGDRPAPFGSTSYRDDGVLLDFRSTALDWLVVEGAQATYEGTGEVRGRGAHRFLVSVVDNGALDRFRIRIEAPNGAVVYDTQPGDPVTAAPTTPLAGGNLTVHRPR